MGGHSGGGGRAGRGGGGSVSGAYDTQETDLNFYERAALKKYSGDDVYTEVNKALIDGSNLGKNTELVATIDAALDRNKLAADTKLYRGISPDMADKFGQPGTVFNHKPYASTSDSARQAGGFASRDKSGHIHMMEITAVKGTRATSMKGVTKYPSEREILIGRDTNMRYIGTRITTTPSVITGKPQPTIVYQFETIP